MEKIERIHTESPDKGYRRLNDDLRHDYGIHVNDKRVLRICRARDIRSTADAIRCSTVTEDTNTQVEHSTRNDTEYVSCGLLY